MHDAVDSQKRLSGHWPVWGSNTRLGDTFSANSAIHSWTILNEKTSYIRGFVQYVDGHKLTSTV